MTDKDFKIKIRCLMMTVLSPLFCLFTFIITILAITTTSTSIEADGQKEVINIGVLIPRLTFRDQYGFASSIKTATHMINNSTLLLENYKIILHLRETHGRVGNTLESFYDLIYNEPKMHAILGPGYSAPAKAVAELCTLLAVIQVSYSAVDPTLLSSTKYPWFFRTAPSIESFNLARISFMDHFKWSSVAVLYDYTNNLFFQTTDHLSKMLDANNFTTLSISGFASDVQTQMNKIQNQDARIIIGEVSQNGARKIFCEAFKRGLYGKKYVWIVSQGLLKTWYADGAPDVTCNSTQMLQAAEGHFIAARSDLRTDDTKTMFGKTAEETWNMIKATKRLDYYDNQAIPEDKYYPGSTFGYDAMVVLAKALNDAEQIGAVNFTTYKYKDYRTVLGVRKNLMESSMEGITGRLTYDPKTRERLGEIVIRQFRKGEYKTVARHYTATNILVMDPTERSSLFTDGVIPRDRATIVKEPITYHVYLVAILWSLTLFGCVLALVFLVINIKYSEVKVIKMSSPKINNVICIGSILSYLAVILYGLDSRLVADESLPFVCNSIAILLAVGFTLSFGGLFSKTWRVYKVFTASKTMSRVVIKDEQLFGIIFVLLLIDIGIYIAWMIASPYHLVTVELEGIEQNAENDIIKIPYINQCQCDYHIHFTSALYAYKGLLLIFGLFLAWETRSVSVAVLNDSKQIGMAVYNVSVLAALGVIMQLAIVSTNNPNIAYVTVALCVVLATTATLILIFAPKIRMLVRKDRNDTTFRTFKSNNTITSNHMTSQVTLASPPQSSFSRPDVDGVVDDVGEFRRTPGLETTVSTVIDGSKVYLGPSNSNEG